MKRWLFLLVVLVTGCSSTEAVNNSLFLLPSIQSSPVAAKSAPVLVVKTELAEYLNQSGLVYRTSESEVVLAKQNLWAHQLSDQINQRLVNDLRAKQKLYWPVQLNSALQLSNQPQLHLRLLKFNGSYNGNAEISGEWLLISAEGKLLKNEYFQLDQALESEGYNGLVKALSQGLEHLTAQIAEKL